MKQNMAHLNNCNWYLLGKRKSVFSSRFSPGISTTLQGSTYVQGLVGQYKTFTMLIRFMLLFLLMVAVVVV